MKNKIVLFFAIAFGLSFLVGCDPQPATPPPPPPAKIANGQQVLVKVSKMIATVTSRKEANADLGDLYVVRYTAITGDLANAEFREWELQPISIEVKAEIDDSNIFNH